MAESMKGLKRSHRCGELSAANVGQKVTVMGWVQKNRNKGSLVFVDLRDFYRLFLRKDRFRKNALQKQADSEVSLLLPLSVRLS